MVTPNPKEIEAVLNLNKQKRYKYFIKKVVDNERIWGLYNGKWKLVDDCGKSYLVLWPYKKFIELCTKTDGTKYSPKQIDIDYFVEEMLEELKDNDINICVFLTKNDSGLCLDADNLEKDLLEEMEGY